MTESMVNPFSDVDTSGRAAELFEYLDHADRGLRAPKQTLRAGLGLVAGSRVLDLGCGAGHELVELEQAGSHAYGVDPSAAMLNASRDRLADHGHPARLTLADGQQLPFADGYFDGCRIERVLQHVPDPAAVLSQARRVLRPGGLIAILEPDWASLTLSSTDPEATRAVEDHVGADIAHRDIGRHLRRLLVASLAGRAAPVVRGRGVPRHDQSLDARLGAAALEGKPWPIKRFDLFKI